MAKESFIVEFPPWHSGLIIQLQKLRLLQRCGFNPSQAQWVKGSSVVTAVAQVTAVA